MKLMRYVVVLMLLASMFTLASAYEWDDGTNHVEGDIAVGADGEIAMSMAVVEDYAAAPVVDIATDTTAGAEVTTDVAATAEEITVASAASDGDGNVAGTVTEVVEGTDVAITQTAAAETGLGADATTDVTADTAAEVTIATGAVAADGASASTVFEGTDVIDLDVSQSAFADGAAGAGQTIIDTAGSNIFAETTAADGAGNSVEFTVYADSALIGVVSQGAAADPNDGAAGGQSIVMFGSGFVGAWADADNEDGCAAEADIEAEGTLVGILADQYADADWYDAEAGQSGVVGSNGWADAETSSVNAWGEESGVDAYVVGGSVDFFQDTESQDYDGSWSSQDSTVDGAYGYIGAWAYSDNLVLDDLDYAEVGVEVWNGEASALQYAEYYWDTEEAYAVQDATATGEYADAWAYAETNGGNLFEQYAEVGAWVNDGTLAVDQYATTDPFLGGDVGAFQDATVIVDNDDDFFFPDGGTYAEAGGIFKEAAVGTTIWGEGQIDALDFASSGVGEPAFAGEFQENDAPFSITSAYAHGAGWPDWDFSFSDDTAAFAVAYAFGSDWAIVF